MNIFSKRINKLLKKMSEENLDVAIITDEDNVYYFSGYYDYLHMEFGSPTILLVSQNKGTLLIDEVTEIPIETQANILRVLIDQKFKRVNGKNDVLVNVRIISSTSRNLLEEYPNGNPELNLLSKEKQLKSKLKL